jgi:hypothetical protein
VVEPASKDQEVDIFDDHSSFLDGRSISRDYDLVKMMLMATFSGLNFG